MPDTGWPIAGKECGRLFGRILNREISDYKDRWRERKKQARDGGQSANLYRDVLNKK